MIFAPEFWGFSWLSENVTVILERLLVFIFITIKCNGYILKYFIDSVLKI